MNFMTRIHQLIDGAGARARLCSLILVAFGAAMWPGSGFASDVEEIPNFIAMRGEWVSIGVRAEPAEVFDEMPALAQRHFISAEPTRIQPGVHFTVDQIIDGRPHKTELTYYYVMASKKSFGLIASEGSPPSRAIIEHGSEFDRLTIFNSEGDVVWTEKSVWKTADAFQSEGVFPFNGGEAKVWFMTERNPAKEKD